MLNEVDEVAMAIWTADTGLSAKVLWILVDKTHYRRLASAAIDRLTELNAL